MRNQFLIPVFSFCDSISNSSSEVFLASGNKTLSTIEEIIERLVDIYNEESELYNLQNKDKQYFWPRQIIEKSKIWTDIFDKLEINEFNIEIPKSLSQFDKLVSEGWCRSNWKGHDFDAQRKIQEIWDFRYKLEQDPKRTPYPEKDKLSAKEFRNQEAKYNKEWRKILDEVDKYQDKVLADYYKAYEVELVEFYKQIAKANNLKFEDFGKYKFDHYQESVYINFDRKYDDDSKISKLLNEVISITPFASN